MPAGMELFPSANDEQFEYIKRIINESDYYVLIIGGKYGSTDAEGLSFTEKEYDYAVHMNKPILSFIHSTPENLPANKYELDSKKRKKLDAFKKKVTQNRLVKFWETSEQLASQVIVSLTDAIERYPQAGWIRNQSNLHGATETFQTFISQFSDYLSQNTKLETQISNISQQMDLLRTDFVSEKNKNQASKTRLEIFELSKQKLDAYELSEQQIDTLSAEERQSYFDKEGDNIKAVIEGDPQAAFLEIALGAFSNAMSNEDSGADSDFNYLAGMAIQYSDYSILTEIAMTLLKAMLILKKNDPNCIELEIGNVKNIVDNNCFIRIRLAAILIIDLIYQEMDGKLDINNDFESNGRDLMFSFIDAAIQYDRDQKTKN